MRTPKLLKIAFGAVVVMFSVGVSTAMACPNWQYGPSFGRINVNTGQFLYQSYQRYIGAGGYYDLTYCINNSWGYAAQAPDFEVWYGGGYHLTFEVQSQYDTVLLVNDPYGNWYFDDDTFGLNPAITFYNAANGVYDVWVGLYRQGSNFPAYLYIYED